MFGRGSGNVSKGVIDLFLLQCRLIYLVIDSHPPGNHIDQIVQVNARVHPLENGAKQRSEVEALEII